jgi:act minimal PKS ketosynthase (KS/KS alpha)
VKRVAITGIGVTAPGGRGTDGFWRLLTEGRTATRKITLFDATGYRSRIAAECDFDARAEGFSEREIRRMDRAGQLAVHSTREAVADSGIDLGACEPGRVSVSVGSATGATTGLESEYAVLSDNGGKWLLDAEHAVPQLHDYFVPSSLAADVAWAVGAEGQVAVISSGCTSGIDSIGFARQLILEGSADVVIAGATDAPISPITVACFDAIRATSSFNDSAETASRPFDLSRNGFVLAEGAAMFVMEELSAARRRGAHVYAEVTGFASRCNAYHMTGLRPDGREMAHAIDSALREAKLDPGDVDYVNAHGSGTKQNDLHETAAFKRSLGEHAYQVPVSSIKSMVGHSLGAIGAIEIAACALAIEHSVIPPTANLNERDPACDLDYVPLTAREARLRSVLSVGSGFGGFQSAVVISAPDLAVA